MKKDLQKLIKKLVETSFKDGRMLEAPILKSIKTLKSLPKGQAIEALTEYLRELKLKERQHTLYLETTVSCSSSQSSKIKNIVQKKSKITKVITQINPQILGGFKLQVGDEIWDESILGKVSQVQEAITSG